MKWSWKIGRFAGIDAYVHASFLLLVAWAAWAAYSGAGTGIAAILGVVFLLAVFGSVLLHELGHALVARRYGIRTRRIVLLPIGGVAQLEGEPRTARQELAIALAGPAVNLAIAAGLFVMQFAGFPSIFGLAGSLMIANLSLAVFNLIPAFPMDGGRVLRALLSMRLGHRRATSIAVWIGKSAALAVGLVGLFTNVMLVLVATFVWFAARAEERRLHADDDDWNDQHDGYGDWFTHDPARTVYGAPVRHGVATPWRAWQRDHAVRQPLPRGRIVMIMGRPFLIR